MVLPKWYWTYLAQKAIQVSNVVPEPPTLLVSLLPPVPVPVLPPPLLGPHTIVLRTRLLVHQVTSTFKLHIMVIFVSSHHSRFCLPITLSLAIFIAEFLIVPLIFVYVAHCTLESLLVMFRLRFRTLQVFLEHPCQGYLWLVPLTQRCGVPQTHLFNLGVFDFRIRQVFRSSCYVAIR